MNLQAEIDRFLEMTPVKAADLEAMKKQAASESWDVALNTFIRFHDMALDVMRENQLKGVELETTKQRIIDRLQTSWLAND